MANNGSFGSQAMMNKIYRGQQASKAAWKKKPAFSPKGNANAKAMLTGKYGSPAVKGKLKNAANKMFGL